MRTAIRQFAKPAPYCVLLAILLIVGFYGFCAIREKYTTINPDATYHATMMVQTMMDHPLNDHLFLPIMNYNNELDKNTKWGACLKDKEGNLFYLSFPPAYIVVPYCFFKAFGIEGSISNVQMFSLFVNLMSLIILFFMLKNCFQKDDSFSIIPIIGVAIYAFSIETLNAQCEWWAQMLFQPLIMLFIIVRLRIETIANDSGRKRRLIFYFCLLVIITFLLIMTEWSAIPALCGAIIGEMYLWLHNRKKRILGRQDRSLVRDPLLMTIMIVSGVAIAAMVLFIVIDSKIDLITMMAYLSNRHHARASGSVMSLLNAYFLSIGQLYWILLLLLSLLPFVTRFVSADMTKLAFATIILLFASLENIVVKQHAVAYTYDRLKGVLLFSLLCCSLCNIIFNFFKEKRGFFFLIVTSLLVSVFLCSYENVCIAKESSANRFDYNNMWEANTQIVSQLYSTTKELDNKRILYAASESHRANINLLFRRNLQIVLTEKEVKDLLLQKTEIDGIVYVKIKQVYRDCDLIDSIVVYQKDNGAIKEDIITMPSLSCFYSCISPSSLVKGYTNLYKAQYTECLCLDEICRNEWSTKTFPRVIIKQHNNSFYYLAEKSNSFRGKQICFFSSFETQRTDNLIPIYNGFFTDENWTNGWGKDRFINVFCLPSLYNSFFPGFFKPERKILFPDGVERTIIGVSQNHGDYIHVSYSGSPYISKTHKPDDLLSLNLKNNKHFNPTDNPVPTDTSFFVIPLESNLQQPSSSTKLPTAISAEDQRI